MLVIAPFLYWLFFFSYGAPVLAVPIPADFPSKYGGYRGDIPDTDNHDRNAGVSHLHRRIVPETSWRYFNSDFKKMAGAVLGTSILGGIGYVAFSNKVKSALGMRTDPEEKEEEAPAKGTTPKHSHYSTVKTSPPAAPVAKTTSSSASTGSGSNPNSDPDSVPGPSKSDPVMYAGEDLTAWVGGTSSQRKRSIAFSDGHQHHLERHSPAFWNSELFKEITKGTKSEVKMAALFGSAMVVAMGAFSHFSGSKKNGTETGGPETVHRGPHSSYASSSVASVVPPSTNHPDAQTKS
ncbi:hypothetical protein FRB93_011634 [Tulasnella sp. JGI-2019a]|nr:hypothetical protein FRB93_011634 [Tulasnella sp. JGI-2019a]